MSTSRLAARAARSRTAPALRRSLAAGTVWGEPPITRRTSAARGHFIGLTPQPAVAFFVTGLSLLPTSYLAQLNPEKVRTPNRRTGAGKSSDKPLRTDTLSVVYDLTLLPAHGGKPPVEWRRLVAVALFEPRAHTEINATGEVMRGHARPHEIFSEQMSFSFAEKMVDGRVGCEFPDDSVIRRVPAVLCCPASLVAWLDDA